MLTHSRQFHCYAGLHGGFIDYNGNVGACEILNSIGNLRDWGYDFLKIWNSDAAENVFAKVGKCETCNYCTHESEGLLPSISFPPNTISVPSYNTQR